jgi:hypothetical protein
MKDQAIHSDVLDMLLQLLREVPAISNLNCSMETGGSGKQPVIHVKAGTDLYRLFVETRVNGQPRYVREAVAHLLMKSGQSRGNTYPVFAAPFISESSAEICRQVGAGYMDLAGNCRLAFGGIYVERQGRPNRFVTRRSLRSLYQSRSSRVLRTLLFDPLLVWKLTDLSMASGVSIGQVFNVKKALIDREWALFDKGGLRLTQPEKVLQDWGDHYAHDRNLSFDFYSPADLSQTESRLARYLSGKGFRYALTSLSAYARMVPEADYGRVYVYIDADRDTDVAQTAKDLNFKPVLKGANATLLMPHDDGVFFGAREMEEMTVVSPVQAYLDLKSAGDAGTKAAEDIFRRILQKR